MQSQLVWTAFRVLFHSCNVVKPAAYYQILQRNSSPQDICAVCSNFLCFSPSIMHHLWEPLNWNFNGGSPLLSPQIRVIPRLQEGAIPTFSAVFCFFKKKCVWHFSTLIWAGKATDFLDSPPSPSCSIDLLSYLNTEFSIQVCKCNINKMTYPAEPEGLSLPGSWNNLRQAKATA